MDFGEIQVDDALGAILAHSLRLPAKTLKKGRVLKAEDLQVLREAEYKTVVAARLGPDDIAEDDAANRLVLAVAGDNVTIGKAFTGRANLYAGKSGVVAYDPARLDAFNLVNESVTLGLVPPYQSVENGQMIGTMKIIPFAVPGDAVLITEAIAMKDGDFVSVAPYVPTRVGLVQTTLPGTKDSVLDSTLEVTRARLHPMGCELNHEVRCAHDISEIGKAIEDCLKAGAGMVLVSGASAVVDRRDVVPAGIEKAGGVIEHFGMPVDPGNLMLIGRIGDVPVIGLPGCARSPKLNGFDWVLQRMIAALPVGGREIMRMGAGGLLKDIPTRPMPRFRRRGQEADAANAEAGNEGIGADNGTQGVTGRPKIAGLILAGGQSRRMGTRNKLLAEIDGVAMVRRVLDNIVASQAAPITVVLGHQGDAVREALEGALPEGVEIRFTRNPDFAEGLSTSLKTGISALDEDVDGVIVCLGDMPRVGADTIDRMIAAFDPLEGRAIVVPTRGGKRGNPVLFARRFFDEITGVAGDVGARHLIGRYEDLVVEIEIEDDSVLLDVDTPEALARITGASGTEDRG
jgi:molybdenum cofactor cytidylyltransferase